MRLSLDLDSGVVSPQGDSGSNVTLLDLSFGEGSIEFQLFRSGALATLIPQLSGSTLIDPATLQLLAKADDGNPAGPQIVAGSVDVNTLQTDPASFPILKCGEDWASAVLADLLTASSGSPVALVAKLRWQNGGDVTWNYSRNFLIQVRANMYATGITPATPSAWAQIVPLTSITLLTGGTPGESPVIHLDAYPVTSYPALTRFDVVTDLGGGIWSMSSWQKRAWTGGSPPVTDAPGGTIAPVDYDASTNKYALIRVGGL